MLRFIYILILLLPVSHAEVKKIVVWERIKDNPFYLKVLVESLKLTEKKYGKAELVPSSSFSHEEAYKRLIVGDEIQLATFAPTNERRQELIEIPIPISRGILGLRVCLIHAEDQLLFAAIRKLSDFKKFGIKFAVGKSWSDKEVMVHNNLDVLEAESYDGVVNLAVINKKVCFSRSLNEVLNETGSSRAFDLVVEENLLLRYDLPSYIYVTKNNPLLAKRLTEGLKTLQSETKYYELFWKNFADAFQRFGVKKRRVIRLEMPTKYVSDEVLNDPLMWLPARLSQ